MSFGNPLGLLALAGLFPLFAAYFLRRRQKPIAVSALFLWKTPDQKAQAGPRFERFSRELSLLLETLCVLAVALYLADLRFGADRPRRSLTAVLDGSLSMQAKRTDGRTVAEAALSVLRTRVGKGGVDLLTVVESGASPRVLAGPLATIDEAERALSTFAPYGASHDLSATLTMARELAGPGKKVLLLTDHLPDEASLSDEVEVVALGEARPNVAFVSAQRFDEGNGATVSLRIANLSEEDRTVKVTLTAAPLGKAPATPTREQEVKLPKGGSALVKASFQYAGAVTAVLPDDALAADGKVALLPAPVSELPVQLLEGMGAAERSAVGSFLSIAPGVQLSLAEGQSPALSFGPRGTAANATFGAPGKQRTFVGPFFSEKSHPLLEDVDLSGVLWTAGENPPGHPLVSAGEVALLTEDEGGAVHFNLDLSRSNLQRTANFPVLLGNLLRRARVAQPGLPKRHVMLGEEVPVVTAAGARYSLKGPAGERTLFGVGATTLPSLDVPGRYELLRDGVAQGELQVLPLDARESNLLDRKSGERAAKGEDAPADESGRRRPSWPLFAFLGLALADFALTRRTT